MYGIVKEKLGRIIRENGLYEGMVRVSARPLTAKEAIGNPMREDFPLLVGKERLMQAEFNGSIGHAFTDMYGNFEGTVRDILAMKLKNNFERAIFISTLNAVMRHLDLICGTVHCKDNDPEDCGRDLVEFISEDYGKPKIAFVGFQPALIEHCSKRFEVRILDLDEENIGKERFGAMILNGNTDMEKTFEWCDLAMVTGTTVVNGTIEPILAMADETKTPVVFYGVTIAGVAGLLNLRRFCTRSK